MSGYIVTHTLRFSIFTCWAKHLPMEAISTSTISVSIPMPLPFLLTITPHYSVPFVQNQMEYLVFNTWGLRSHLHKGYHLPVLTPLWQALSGREQAFIHTVRLKFGTPHRSAQNKSIILWVGRKMRMQALWQLAHRDGSFMKRDWLGGKQRMPGKAETTFFKDATPETLTVLKRMVLHHAYAGSTEWTQIEKEQMRFRGEKCWPGVREELEGKDVHEVE